MTSLITENIGSQIAPIVVLFGRSPIRRSEVIKVITDGVDITVYGVLSEDEGMASQF